MSNAPRTQSANRDWGSDDSGASIMHVDMDAFYASVEVARRPVLRGKPVVVGGGDRSVVLAATYEARELGVKSAMPVSRAKALAPGAIFIDPDMRAYRDVSRGVMEILRSITPEIEQVSVDEAFLDIAGSRKRLGSALEIGAALRQHIQAKYSVTASVGIGANKFVAKLASTNCKPDGLMLIPAQRTVEFIHCLPVGALWGVGEKTALRLSNWGVETVEQLAHLALPDLTRMVGDASAKHLHALAWGRDSREIVTHRVEKSIGAERTFERDVTDEATLHKTLWALADECGRRLRAKSLVTRTIAIKVRNANFETTNRSATLKSPTSSSKAIYEASRELLMSLKRVEATRLIGVRLENLEEESLTSFQDTLFESDSGSSQALEKSEQVMDQIRAKFGISSIERAAQSGIRLSRLE